MDTRRTVRSTTKPTIQLLEFKTVGRQTRSQQKVAESQPSDEVLVECLVQQVVEEEVVQHQEAIDDDEDNQMVEETVEESAVEEEDPDGEPVDDEVDEELQQTSSRADGDQQSDQQLMSDELANYWTEEKHLRDGRVDFVCKWLLCSFRTQSECSIRKHAVKHQKPYMCSFVGCGERFTQTSELLKHFQETHLDSNAFKCNFADCQQRFNDIKQLTAHRVTHVSHTTQLIKANKDYKPGISRNRSLPQELQQFFTQNNENLTTTIEMVEGLPEDHYYMTGTVLNIDASSLQAIDPSGQDYDRYRNKRMNSVIRCPISSLTDDIVEGNDNYVKCRTFDGKFWYKCLWDYCDYGNINEGIIRRHVLKHEFPHKCSFDACNKSFATISEMAEHRAVSHSGPNPYACDWPECSEAFPSLKDLTEHKRNHLVDTSPGSGNRVKKSKPPVPPKPFMCDFGKCNMHYSTEEELEIHKQIHSGDRPYKCQYPECTFAAKSKDKLQIHHSRHSAVKQFHCLWPTCDKSFTISEQLRRHRKLHTNREQLICEFADCDLVFETADDLERHLRRHIGLDESTIQLMSPMGFKCDFGLCKMHFQTRLELENHRRSHNAGDRLFKCGFDNKCSYTAKTLDKLTAHLRYHSGERPFKCDFIGCHQDFIQSHHLARHRKTHFGGNSVNRLQVDEQYICQFEDCPHVYADEASLEVHYQNEHSLEANNIEPKPKAKKRKIVKKSEEQTEESNELSEIGLELVESQLKKKRVNRKAKKESTEEKEISCGFSKCTFKCSTDEELAEHKDSQHSGDRPFVCEFLDCSFRTNRKDKLTIHTRRHTGEKPFKCDWNECNRTFISKEHLNRHNLTHFKSKQSVNKDQDFDKALKELDQLLHETETDANEEANE